MHGQRLKVSADVTRQHLQHRTEAGLSHHNSGSVFNTLTYNHREEVEMRQMES